MSHFGNSNKSKQSYTHKKCNILGENPRPISLFTYYLFEDYICPFPKKLASHNSMQKKED